MSIPADSAVRYENEHQVWGHIYPLLQEKVIVSAVCEQAFKGRVGFRVTISSLWPGHSCALAVLISEGDPAAPLYV